MDKYIFWNHFTLLGVFFSFVIHNDTNFESRKISAFWICYFETMRNKKKITRILLERTGKIQSEKNRRKKKTEMRAQNAKLPWQNSNNDRFALMYAGWMDSFIKQVKKLHIFWRHSLSAISLSFFVVGKLWNFYAARAKNRPWMGVKERIRAKTWCEQKKWRLTGC